MDLCVFEPVVMHYLNIFRLNLTEKAIPWTLLCYYLERIIGGPIPHAGKVWIPLALNCLALLLCIH